VARLLERPEWGGVARSWARIPRVDQVFIHHSVTPASQALGAAMQMLEGHAVGLGHNGIDYSFVVKVGGERAVGRGWWAAGGHTINNNSTSYGICGLGDFRSDRADDAMIQSFADTIREGVALGAIAPNPRIRPHSDVFATACPSTLKDVIPQIAARVAGGGTPTPTGSSTMKVVAVPIPNVGVLSYLVDGGVWVRQFNSAPAGPFGIPQAGIDFAAQNGLGNVIGLTLDEWNAYVKRTDTNGPIRTLLSKMFPAKAARAEA